MSEPRSQGRPHAEERQFGREKLLEKTRVAMRRSPRAELQRRDIAEVAGVTPALINYYFPKKWELLEAAAAPVIEDYVSQVSHLVNSDKSTYDKLKDLLKLYIDFNTENGYLLDYYIESNVQLKRSNNITMLWTAHKNIINFLQNSIQKKNIYNIHPELLNAVLWGVGKYISQLPDDRRAALLPQDPTSSSHSSPSDAVFALLFNGLLPRDESDNHDIAVGTLKLSGKI